MTDQLKARIIELYALGMDIDAIAFDTGGAKGDVRMIISEETAATLEHAIRRGNHRYEDTLYSRHLSGTTGRRA